MKKIFILSLLLLSSCGQEDEDFTPYPGGKSNCCQQVDKILQ